MMARLLNGRFIKFILVGMLNTGFSYLVFAFFIFLGLHYALAVFLAAVMGALFNFKTIGTLVFQNGANGLLFRFLGVYLSTYLLNVAALRVCAGLGMSMYLAGFLVAIPMAAVSFLLLSRFVFQRGTGPERDAESVCRQH
ncbi:GtrA family protein [Geobacter sp. DSM 9736]|uniref:GtrA family protein n=1 Tax=Geobacter sp. DSM 9736 TaxID=1277350 RepID=UPI000B50040A|nr:GtrA family protein [Geobacter sp. DSM 9736]SNB48122.1 Putative flippase GtrA (transmembrane translocase of bactoprenol-linked glucose) [Geobacter sp. DSM 9736]